MSVYFGFGIAPSMFPASCTIQRSALSVELVRDFVARGVIACLNPSHVATISVMQQRFGINVEIPVKAPSVKLGDGDMLICMGVSGLPRLEGRHEYTNDEIQNARFDFSLFCVETANAF